MSIKRNLFLLLCGLIWLLNVVPARAQVAAASPNSNQTAPVEDIVRVSTRVVFIDTLVRDKKTGAPVTDLPLESFQVLDDDKPRKLSYFSREGLTRRPLALMLVLDLSTSGILYMEKPEVMEQIISALSKLKPADAVAVMQRWYEPQGPALSFELNSRLFPYFTPNPPQTSAPLAEF